MSTNDNKRYYWLRLKKDFFRRHDIQIIESMKNGKDYVLFYLKLLCESTSHDGRLKFSDTIPYNEDMLATITNTNIDIVRSAIKILQELNMVAILDDGTYYMPEVNKMIGSETGKAQRMREYREKVGATSGLQCSPEKEIEKDKEIDIDIDTYDDVVIPTITNTNLDKNSNTTHSSNYKDISILTIEDKTILYFYKENIEKEITPVVQKELLSLVKECGAEKVRYAIKESSLQNKKSFKYVAAVARGNGKKKTGKENEWMGVIDEVHQELVEKGIYKE